MKIRELMMAEGYVSPGRLTTRDVCDDGDDKYGSRGGVIIIVTNVTIVTERGKRKRIWAEMFRLLQSCFTFW